MPASPRERLDVLLVERGLAPSRERAQALIMAGRVTVAGVVESKSGTRVAVDAALAVKEPPVPYASRGGLKLEKALDAFGIDVAGKVCMDVGASTGGFTDCLLQRGAARVYAVDVGYGQLAVALREDPRVVVLEKVNARYLDATHVPEKVDFACVDVSFISLEKVWTAVTARLKDDGDVVALVKPQFEAGAKDVGKGGVVRDAEVHRRVLTNVIQVVWHSNMDVAGLTHSPVRGPKGNLEFLLWARRPMVGTNIPLNTIVAAAHEALS